MLRTLIPEMRCPYCSGDMRLSREVEGNAERVQFGLLSCRCFEFPVVDGIPLLSLAKGYGGSEESLQPYVPLQVAAIHYLKKDDVAGLRGWIARHLPIADQLMNGHAGAYIPFMASMMLDVEKASSAYLVENSSYEFLGHPKPASALKRFLGPGLLHHWRHYKRTKTARKDWRAWELQQLTGYFPARFFSPRVNALALQLGSLPTDGKILSLCCGHGVFENVLNLLGKNKDVVSIDGQFLNLLITRRYVYPQGTFICHDLQFPFPFKNGAFDGVFSSTCLPEIPAQKSFVSEAVRVTRDTGWTFMDSIWNLDIGVQRVDPLRGYRFCQNFFSDLEDYLPFFDDCAPNRDIALDVPALPARYKDRSTWIVERDAMLGAIKSRADWQISIVTTTPGRFGGFKTPVEPTWFKPDALAVSPAYDVTAVTADAVELKRRGLFAELQRGFAPKAMAELPERVSLQRGRFADAGYLSEQFCAGILVALPRQFDSVSTHLTDLH